jgi:hypothetical protein
MFSRVLKDQIQSIWRELKFPADFAYRSALVNYFNFFGETWENSVENSVGIQTEEEKNKKKLFWEKILNHMSEKFRGKNGEILPGNFPEISTINKSCLFQKKKKKN